MIRSSYENNPVVKQETRSKTQHFKHLGKTVMTEKDNRVAFVFEIMMS